MSKRFPSRVKQLLCQPVFLCLVSFICCSFIALLFFLPLEPFARQLEQQAERQGFELQVEQPRLLFPFGLGADRVQISHKQRQHPPFMLEHIDLRPLWLSLLGANPGLGFKLETWQGKIIGTAHRNGKVQATLSGLHFKERLDPKLALILAGTLKKGTFDGTLPLAGKNRSQLKLELSDLQLTGLQKFGSGSDLLSLGRLTCTVESKGSLIQINRLSSTGPAFDITANGSLRIGRTVAGSSLNLTLFLTPKDLDPALRDLLTLIKKPQQDGSYQFRLRGSLSQVRIN